MARPDFSSLDSKLPLGILAGSGPLPRKLVDFCKGNKRSVFVMAFEGQTDLDTVQGVAHAWFRLGAGGAVIDTLKAQAVRDLVMIGPIRRPSMTELRPDWRTLQFFAKVGMKSLGDDSLLRGIMAALEDEGFCFLAVDDVLRDWVMPVGYLVGGDDSSDGFDLRQGDIRRGIEVARALGAVDVGQSVVVQDSLVLAVEGIEGTDALIQRTHTLKRAGVGPVLVKLKKPGQDRRADLPTVGVQTVNNAIEAGFRGIALEAGGSLLIDRDEVIQRAGEAGLFVLGLDLGAPGWDGADAGAPL